MSAIEAFADVEVSALADWLRAIPLGEWPGMVDPKWHGAGARFAPLADDLMEHFADCSRSGIGLFLLGAGQVHPAHVDIQPPDWLTRVHVPIVTNERATVTTDEVTLHMQVGKAYRFDTRARHAVSNGGTEPRVHLVFDVRRKA